MSYILLNVSEDGDVYVHGIRDIKKFLDDFNKDGYSIESFHNSIPAGYADVRNWGRGYMLIRGEVVIPKVVETAIKYVLEDGE